MTTGMTSKKLATIPTRRRDSRQGDRPATSAPANDAVRSVPYSPRDRRLASEPVSSSPCLLCLAVFIPRLLCVAVFIPRLSLLLPSFPEDRSENCRAPKKNEEC